VLNLPLVADITLLHNGTTESAVKQVC